MTNGEWLSRREQFNTEGAQEVSATAEQIRSGAIDFAYKIMEARLQADHAAFEELEAQGFPEGRHVERFVLEDMRAAPLQEGDVPQRTFSILFIPRVLREDAELLRVHIPVPDDVTLEDYTLPPLEEVDHIYLEYVKPGVIPRRYVLDRRFMYEYVSAADVGEDQVLGSTEDIMRKAKQRPRTDDTILLATQARIDLIEMNVIPQRINRQGDTTFFDLPDKSF